MSVEWDILALGSRVFLSESEVEQLQELSRTDVDWQELLTLADFHRTLALVYRQLSKHCADTLPIQLMDSVKSRLRRQGIGNLLMSSVLLQVLAALEEKGIQAVPFKGPVFTESIFGDLALRSYCDLDILIAVTDLPGAVAVIKEAGFRPMFPLANRQLKILAKTDNEYPLQHQAKGVAVDLQWELIGGYSSRPLYLDTLLPNVCSVNFLGKSVPVLGREDLLVYLCIHGNQHVWEQLDQVCCVAETIKTSEDLRWNLVWERAAELRVGRMVRIGLLLASRLLAAELPADVAAVITMDRQAVMLAQDRAEKLARPLSMKSEGMTSRRFVLYHWKSLDSPWQVIRYGCHILFVPTRYDWQKFPLPVWMSPLHYLYRPLRLLLTGVMAVLKARMR